MQESYETSYFRKRFSDAKPYYSVNMLIMGNVYLTINKHELIASIDIEDKPHLNMTHSITLLGKNISNCLHI